MSIIQGLLYCWNKNLQYGRRLVEDLTDEQMVLQPAPVGNAPANHPAWVFSHLNAYLPAIQALIKGEEFDDPKQHPFGMLSKPEADAKLYPPKAELIQEFVAGHENVGELLRDCTEEIFQQPVSLPRWSPIMPNLGTALPYVMINHENMHLGQISAWRRIQGLPSV